MRHFPIFLDLAGRRVIVAGAGETALAKLRLLARTEAAISVFGCEPAPGVRALAGAGRIALAERRAEEADLAGAALVYAAHDDDVEDTRVRDLARAAGLPVNVVDDLEASDFITPAIVDRDPVTVAIGTEGTAPMLARRIKAELEERLSPRLGLVARVAARFRTRAAAIPAGGARRAFWARIFGPEGERAAESVGEAGVEALIEHSLATAPAPRGPGRVVLVGAGPGDPELLTLKARKRLHEADVVIHDRLVGPGILDLARREAEIVEVGKMPGGPAWRQEAINALLIDRASAGAMVVRLKSGDPGIFGRLDEELDALSGAGIAWEIVPGITAAASAAASVGASLTRRGRNAAVTLLTGQDMKGFAEHDWKALARPGAAAAVYMGVSAARFVQGRLLLAGADRDTPVTVVENASRPEEVMAAGTLATLPETLARSGIAGPAILFIGIPPRRIGRGASVATPRAVSDLALARA